MLERLKALFRVKERQDFRTLYTDPPISFFEEYPEIPKPEPRLSPVLLSARWVLRDLRGEDMPGLAADLLEGGYDTPSLRRLAGEDCAQCGADIAVLVEKMFRESSAPFPISETEAKLTFTRQIARQVIAGERNAWAAASHLNTVVWNRKAEDTDLRDISELLDSLDWNAVNRDMLPQLTSELLAVFARLGARQPGERRRFRLGLLRGKGWIADDFDAPLPEDIQAQFEGREPKQD